MSYRPKGKHVSISFDSPEALGICDYTGFVHLRKDLIRQMEWRGNRLVWTGYYVGRDYLDIPNPQLKPPILPPDPVPVLDPRPPQYSAITWSQTDIVWKFDGDVWDEAGGFSLDIQALPVDQRLQLLENYNWGLN